MIAQSNSERLVRLINDILDIEKTRVRQRLGSTLKRVEVTTLVEQTIEANARIGRRLRRTASPRAIRRPRGVRRSRPARAGRHQPAVERDKVLAPCGRGPVVSVDAHNDMVRISVRDHGAGTSRELQASCLREIRSGRGPHAAEGRHRARAEHREADRPCNSAARWILSMRRAAERSFTSSFPA